MSYYTKTIVVNSPPGSGGIFCRELIRNNLAADIVWPLHDLYGFQKDDVNVCVIRDPYDSLASAIEVGFFDVTDYIKDFYNNDIDLMINDQLMWHLSNYMRFLNLSEKFIYITPVTFDFLTNRPDAFLKYISNKFEIDFLEKSVSAEETKTLIKSDSRHSTRAPREKTDLRKKIDDIVRDYEPVKYAYQEYIRLVDTIQSTENML
jgi:hypothetical protein